MNEPVSLSAGAAGLIVNVPPVVRVEGFFQIGPHCIPTTFDLTGLPKEHHQLFWQLVQSRSCAVVLPRNEPEPPSPRKDRRSLLSRILDWRQ